MSTKLLKGSSFKVQSPLGNNPTNPYQLEYTVTVDSIFRVLGDKDFSGVSTSTIIYQFTVDANIIYGAIAWANHQSLAVEILINGVSSGWEENYIHTRGITWDNKISNSISVWVEVEDVTKIDDVSFQFKVHRIKTTNGIDSINTDTAATAGTANTGTDYTIFKPKWPYCVNVDGKWKPCMFRSNSGSSWDSNIHVRPKVNINNTEAIWLDYGR